MDSKQLQEIKEILVDPIVVALEKTNTKLDKFCGEVSSTLSEHTTKIDYIEKSMSRNTNTRWSIILTIFSGLIAFMNGLVLLYLGYLIKQ